MLLCAPRSGPIAEVCPLPLDGSVADYGHALVASCDAPMPFDSSASSSSPPWYEIDAALESMVPDRFGARPLIMASSATEQNQLGVRVGLRRSSLLQPFGIYLADCDGLVCFSEDLPHLNIRKGDVIVAINSRRLTTVTEATELLTRNMNVELVIRRGGSWAPPVSLWNTCQCTSLTPAPGSNMRSQEVVVMREVLSATFPHNLFDQGPGSYEVELQRASYSQKFGLDLVAGDAQGGPGGVYFPADLPHLGCHRGDRIDTVNGITVHTPETCNKLTARCLNLRLGLTRAS